MGNARLDEAQAGIKIAGKNINNLRQHIKKQKHKFADKGLYNQEVWFSSSHVWMESWTIRKLSTEELMLLNCGVEEDS